MNAPREDLVEFALRRLHELGAVLTPGVVDQVDREIREYAAELDSKRQPYIPKRGRIAVRQQRQQVRADALKATGSTDADLAATHKISLASLKRWVKDR